MQQLHQRTFLCPFVLHLFKYAILTAASVLHWLDNQKSLWDVNEQHFTAQHTTDSLWSVCTAVQRFTGNGVSQACWEHDGGPDFASRWSCLMMGEQTVECSFGWVGCGMTVWAPPHTPFLQLSFSENFFSHYLCKEEDRNWQEFLTCTSSYLAASSLLTFLICEEIMIEW